MKSSGHYAALSFINCSVTPAFLLLLHLPTVIYSHSSHGSCCCLLSDSVNSFPQRRMSHRFTLLTPLSFSRSALLPPPPVPPSLLRSKPQKARRGEDQPQKKKTGFSRPRSVSRALCTKPGIQQPALQGLPAFLSILLISHT